MKERLAEFVGIAAIVLLLIVTIVLFAGRDYKGPVISFETDVIFYEGADEAILMDGVTAYDSKDGDVTASILIDSIIVLEGKSTVKVIYIAKDSSNNITRVERYVDYTQDTVPEIPTEDITQENIENTTDNQDNTGNDENESSDENMTSEADENVTESTEAETTTTQPETTAPPETTPAANVAPVMTLKCSEVTISAGGNFRVFDYVESITDDKDTREALFRQLIVDGYYDISTVGDYEIFIYCVDSDKKSSNKESFIIHVREEGSY